MPFTIDTTVSLAALLGGIVGAGIAAYLSYRVQIAVREWEDRKKRSRVLFVHYLQLTDMVAANTLLSRIAKPVAELFISGGDGYDLTHKAAAWLAEAVAEASPAAIAESRARMEANIPLLHEYLRKIELRPTELADFTADGIVQFTRFASCAFGLRIQLSTLNDHLKLNPASLDAAFIHGLYSSWLRFADAAVGLRECLAQSLAISQDRLNTDLERAMRKGGEDIVDMFGQLKNIQNAIASLQSSRSTQGSGKPD